MFSFCSVRIRWLVTVCNWGLISGDFGGFILWGTQNMKTSWVKLSTIPITPEKGFWGRILVGWPSSSDPAVATET